MPELLRLLERIRRAASVRMGIALDLDAAARITSVPFVCLVGPRTDGPTISGQVLRRGDVDVVARALSNGQPHRALPLTIALCLGVAARITGSVVSEVVSRRPDDGALRVGMPSGVLTVDSQVSFDDDRWHAHTGSFYRTARRLFEGRVLVAPAS